MDTAASLNHGYGQQDVYGSILYRFDQSTTNTLGVSALRFLTFASIGASIALYLAGRKQDGIFVGLWTPTFEALKASAEKERSTSVDAPTDACRMARRSKGDKEKLALVQGAGE